MGEDKSKKRRWRKLGKGENETRKENEARSEFSTLMHAIKLYLNKLNYQKCLVCARISKHHWIVDMVGLLEVILVQSSYFTDKKKESSINL